jgi:hypothetical protein
MAMVNIFIYGLGITLTVATWHVTRFTHNFFWFDMCCNRHACRADG